MAIPAVTRVYIPGSCRNSRNRMRHPPRWEMRRDSPACMQSHPVLRIKHVKSLDLLDGTTESSREIPEKSRRTLMSLQEYEIPWGSPNNLKIKPYFPALAPEQFPVPHQTPQVA